MIQMPVYACGGEEMKQITIWLGEDDDDDDENGEVTYCRTDTLTTLEEIGMLQIAQEMAIERWRKERGG